MLNLIKVTVDSLEEVGINKITMKKQYKPGEMYNKMKKKNWIAKAIKNPGALHKQLGIKTGNKIPAKTLAKAAKKGGKLGKRAQLAETLKSLNKNKKHKLDMKGMASEAMKGAKFAGSVGKAFVRNATGGDVKMILGKKKIK